MAALDRYVPVLRGQTVGIFADWGLDPGGEIVYRMELAVSELSANAIAHGPQRDGALIHITWSVHPGPSGVGFAAVTVADAGNGSVRAVAQASGGLSEHHRGLTLLVGMGVRVQPVVLADAHRVTAWTPTDPQTAVCGCACWEHGYDRRWPDGSRVVCGGLLRDDAAVVGERHGLPVVVCAACAYAAGTVHNLARRDRCAVMNAPADPADGARAAVHDALAGAARQAKLAESLTTLADGPTGRLERG